GGSISRTVASTRAPTPMNRTRVEYDAPLANPFGGTPSTFVICRSHLGRFRGLTTTFHTSSGEALTSTEAWARLMPAPSSRNHGTRAPSAPPHEPLGIECHQRGAARIDPR